jgi:hypothetical protein
MKTQFIEQSDINCLSEFDPTPRYKGVYPGSNWVWGLIHTVTYVHYRSISHVFIK